jgi:predicted HicB family RNase H-like nuclease
MAIARVAFQARVPAASHAALAARAKREGTSLNHELNEAIRSYLERSKRERGK